MGIIKAVNQAIGGAFADQRLEVYEADNMGDQTVFSRGVKIRRGENRKGTEDTVTNGSIIHVYDNQFMLLVDGGKIVDYTAEPGYYKVDNSSLPSMFNGQFGDTLKESFNRLRFGGQTPTVQKVYFINLQEIKGIKFGTRQPINYFDTFYNAELFLRAHATYSIKIVNPLQRTRITLKLPRSTSSISQSSWRLYRLQSIRCQQTATVFRLYPAKRVNSDSTWLQFWIRNGTRCEAWRFRQSALRVLIMKSHRNFST